jgi:nicotinamidase-related amidase
LTKHRVSSFVGSGLDVVLSSLGITDLVLAGVSTSTAVLGTAMAAADMDFGLHVLSDACFDARTDAHDLLMEDVLPAMATVLSAEEWAASVAH